MKTSIKLFALGMILMGFGATAFAQSTTSATATATIITPIAITSDQNMSFGNIAVQSATGGTVVLAPDASRTATAGVTATAGLGGTLTAARFTVTGLGSSVYTINLPSTHTIKHSSSTVTMTVDNFKRSNGTSTSTLSAGGSEIFTVGATLNVAGGQAPGVYTSESGSGFEVTVNYN